ncbi:MAG: dihydrolipoyl dehydrogenase [Pseudomonadota bacterium]
MSAFDVVIIGGGPAGYVGAVRAAQLGLKTCLLEENKLGGTCLNVGCIPTKCLLSYAEEIFAAKKPRQGLKINGLDINREEIYSFKNSVVSKLNAGVDMLLKSYGVELKKGKGSFVSNNKISVNGEEIEFKKALIATGSKTTKPKFFNVPGFTIDSTDILENPELKGRVVIVGGGVIGCELAFILTSFGCEVTIVEMLKGILPTEDRDCVRFVETSLKNKGVKIFVDISVQKVEKGKVTLSNGEVLEAEHCVVAVGREPNTEGLNCEKAGVKLGAKNSVTVDAEFKTSNPNIYAVGDVTGGIQLAHYASASACKVIGDMAGKRSNINLNVIPRVTYSIPELASVGVTETEAKEKNVQYRSGKFMYAALGKALAINSTEGMVKVLTDEKDKIIGAAVVGKDADNLITPFTIAVGLGLTATQLSGIIYPHPTLSEMILEACEDVHGMAIHKGRRKN